MIFGHIDAIAQYKGISPLLDQAIDAAQQMTADAPAGVTELVADRQLFYTVSENATLLPEAGQFEVHRRYLDLQYILKGEEQLEIANTPDCTETVAYDPQRDIGFVQGRSNSITLGAGEFYIVFPQDAHKPCCNTKSQMVKKAVFKIKIE
ncbi:MAG: YhcH/YjgK/YiaL family protein [Angelakisella sp.]